jgi:hypothetical protein
LSASDSHHHSAVGVGPVHLAQESKFDQPDRATRVIYQRGNKELDSRLKHAGMTHLLLNAPK